ncbi:MAG: hypothetical protein GF308_12715 [Candidatus Heimdallarchaeota archaeon]|nr:hypothetical protein [Candidatus Heimdallarchaeota archaeon]
MKIKVIGFAKRLLGFEQKEITFQGKKRLDELIDFSDVPENLIAILVNERAATKEVEVTNSDKVIITQIVAGG